MAEPTQPGNNQPPFTIGGDDGPWALEETLKKVLTTLQKDLAVTTREARTIDTLNRNVDRLINVIDRGNTSSNITNRKEVSAAEQSRRALQDIQKSSKRAVASQEELARATKQSKEAARQALLGGGGGGPGGRGAAGAVLGVAKAGVQKLWNSVSSAGQAILQSGGDIQSATQGVAAALPLLGGIMGAAVGMVHQTQEYMNSMAKVGQTFNGSMVTFSQTAAKSALSMGQTAAILTENSQTVSKLGANEFLKLQLNVRRSTEQFGRFGLSIEDQSKIISGFYESQMSLGRRQNATNQRAISDYTAKLSTLSRLTGKSIEQLLEEQQAAADSPDVYAAATRVFERYGKQAAENFQDVVGQSRQVLPDAMKDLSENLLSDYGKYGTIASSDLGAALTSAGRGDIVKQLDQAISSGNAEAYTSVLGRISKDAQEFGNPIRSVLTNLSLGSDAVSQAAKQVIAGTIATAKTNEAALNDVKGETAKTLADTYGGDMAAITQQQTQTQIALGNAQTQLLEASTKLYPSLAKLAEVAAQATADLLQTQTARTAIDEFTAALSKAPGEIENMIGAMKAFSGLDGILSSVITGLMNFGGWLGKMTGIGEGWGQLIVGTLALLAPVRTAKALFTGGKALLGGAAGMLGLGGRAGAGAAAAGGARAAGIAGSGALGVAARAAGGIGGAYTLYEGASRAASSDKTSDNVMGHGQAALGGALTGAAIGSVVPVIGTAVGALAGAAIGGLGSILYDYFDDGDAVKKAKPLPAKPAPGVGTPGSNEVTYHKTRMTNQTAYRSEVKQTNNIELQRMQNLFNLRIKMEQIYSTLQIRLATIRHNYELTLLSKRYQVNAASSRRNQQSKAGSIDTAFRTQVEQAKNIGRSIEQFQNKSAKMGALGQAGIIVQPSIGDDIGSKQLQEMKLTNQFLYNIFDIQRGTRKFRPLVSIYQPGL